MRILSVTQTYAPFLEFGGPPVKVRALARGLARHGHEVTVLTADWGVRARMGTVKRSGATEAFGGEPSPFGWSCVDSGVTTTYLPTWLKYHSVSWNPAVKSFCEARLQDFDLAHIFGLYDLLGPAVAAACVKRKIPYVLEPIGMFVPIVRNLRLKRIYHALFGRRLFEQASAIIATSEQEVESWRAELPGGSCCVGMESGAPESWPERGSFRHGLGIAKEKVFLSRTFVKKSPDLLLGHLLCFQTRKEAHAAGVCRT
jgi:hypothetical protein